MLIPIGFFGAGGASGSYELISTTVLGSSATSVTFTNGGAWAGYKHLQLRVVGRGNTNAGGQRHAALRFNGDSGANYAWHQLSGQGGSVQSSSTSSTNQINIYTFADAGSAANIFGGAVIDILDFQGTKNKTVRSLVGSIGSSGFIYLDSGLWNSTAALTSFELSNAVDWASGSRFSLYGIKG
jgi:hypothetical protein